jgi:hypothetical protein
MVINSMFGCSPKMKFLSDRKKDKCKDFFDRQGKSKPPTIDEVKKAVQDRAKKG